ncbi:MAG: DNA adenine methylase [Phycisphaerae bacterium]
MANKAIVPVSAQSLRLPARSAGRPSRSWDLERLAQYVASELHVSDLIEDNLGPLRRRSVLAVFRAGAALIIVRDRLVERGGWVAWQSQHDLSRKTVNEAIRLFEAAGSEQALDGYSLTEAKVAFGAAAPSVRRPVVVPSAPARFLPVGGDNGKNGDDGDDGNDNETAGGSTPLGWFGGKQGLAKDIVSLFPPDYSDCQYIELFAGGAALLFAKRRSQTEILNDIDQDVHNFWMQLRDHGPELRRRLQLTPCSRVEFAACRKPAGPDGVERAREFFVSATQSHANVVGGNWRIRNNRSTGAEWAAKVDTLESAVERLRTVVLENDDFRTVLKRYDTAETFWFCDPPYLGTAAHHRPYPHCLTKSDHRELLSMLLKVKGRVLLCGYGNPIYGQMLRGWRTWHKEINCLSAKTSRRIEVVWLNY